MNFSRKSVSTGFRLKGFTLIELMVAISIVGILASIALPSFASLINKYRLSNENTSLMLDLVLARGEAVNRSTRVTVCQTADGATCSASGWGAGRIIFVDKGTVGAIDAGDTVLKVSSAIKAGDTMNPNTTAFISYDSTGLPSANYTITTCKSGYTGAVVLIYPTGRIRLDSSGVCP